MDFCTKCGHEIEKGASYCTFCGAPVNGNNHSHNNNKIKHNTCGKVARILFYIYTVPVILFIALLYYLLPVLLPFLIPFIIMYVVLPIIYGYKVKHEEHVSIFLKIFVLIVLSRLIGILMLCDDE